jgi:N4-gp56 family major capsid protein
MAMNLASKFSKKVDERFKLKSLTEAAVNQDYEFTGVATVSVYSVDTATMNDYTRSGSSRYGTASDLGNTKQDLTLTKDRSFTFVIDRGNMDETAGAMESGKALARQNDEVVVPEIDTRRIAVMVTSAVANGGVAATPVAISASNAYTSFLDGNAYLDENKVPRVGRIAFVTPTFYKFIKEDTGFVKASDMAQKMVINGQVGEIDGVKIVMCPSTYFPANTDFVITHPSATVSPKKLQDYKIHDNPPGISGKLVEGRIIYDAVVLTNKTGAIYAHKNA